MPAVGKAEKVLMSPLHIKLGLVKRFVKALNKALNKIGTRCSSVVGAFAHSAMGRRIDPSWGGPIELFLVIDSAPRLV